MAGRERGLDIVARMNEAAEREAAAALRRAEQRLAEEQARLEALRAMIDEYHRDGFAGGRPQRLRETRGFLSQLQAGLEAQLEAVERERCATESARAHWIATRLKRDAFDRLVDERNAEDDRRRERNEQRLVDDRSSRGDHEAFTGTIA